MIPIGYKITIFSLYLFVNFFENIIMIGKFVHIASKKRMASMHLKD